MILKLFAIYDSKIEAYMHPFFMPTTGAALRAWSTTVNDRSTDFNKYPGDYTLFEIASFDDQTGVLNPHVTKINLGLALEVHTSSSQNGLKEVAQ